jgi:hypothetical protein
MFFHFVSYELLVNPLSQELNLQNIGMVVGSLWNGVG